MRAHWDLILIQPTNARLTVKPTNRRKSRFSQSQNHALRSFQKFCMHAEEMGFAGIVSEKPENELPRQAYELHYKFPSAYLKRFPLSFMHNKKCFFLLRRLTILRNERRGAHVFSERFLTPSSMTSLAETCLLLYVCKGHKSLPGGRYICLLHPRGLLSLSRFPKLSVALEFSSMCPKISR